MGQGLIVTQSLVRHVPFDTQYSNSNGDECVVCLFSREKPLFLLCSIQFQLPKSLPLRRDLPSWSSSEVCSWLEESGFSDLVSLFQGESATSAFSFGLNVPCDIFIFFIVFEIACLFFNLQRNSIGKHLAGFHLLFSVLFSKSYNEDSFCSNTSTGYNWSPSFFLQTTPSTEVVWQESPAINSVSLTSDVMMQFLSNCFPPAFSGLW